MIVDANGFITLFAGVDGIPSYSVLINRRRASGVMTRILVVKAHSGETLNEAADVLAGAAAEMDPTRPVDGFVGLAQRTSDQTG